MVGNAPYTALKTEEASLEHAFPYGGVESQCKREAKEMGEQGKGVMDVVP